MTNWHAVPRTVLEHVIREQGLSYDELSEQFDQLAEKMGLGVTLSPRHLRRLASGERTGTRPQSQRVLQEQFGRSAAELLQPWASANTSIEPASGLLIADEHGQVGQSQEELLTVTVRRARQFTLDTGQYVASEAIDQLQGDLREIAVSYPQRALGEILTDLVETQDTVFTLLDRRHRATESTQLYMLGGVVSGILAKASHDMGDAHSALTHARTGFMCADHAEHDGLRAWIRGLQSYVAYWSKRPHESLRYAQEGTVFAELAGNTTGVWLAVNEARAWATLGNSAGAREAIHRSEVAAESVRFDEVDMYGGICTFGRSRQLYYAADALALLPDAADDAEQYSEQALEAYSDTSAPDWSFSDQAGSYADLAIARIMKGEIDGAAAALEPVLELEPGRRIHGIISSADQVHKALGKAESSQAVTDLQLELEAFSRTPLVAIAP